MKTSIYPEFILKSDLQIFVLHEKQNFEYLFIPGLHHNFYDLIDQICYHCNEFDYQLSDAIAIFRTCLYNMKNDKLTTNN